MVERTPRRFGDRRRIAPRPDGLGPALQEEDFILLRYRPFDILRLAIMALDILADREQCRDLRIRQAGLVLLRAPDSTSGTSGTSGPTTTGTGTAAAAGSASRPYSTTGAIAERRNAGPVFEEAQERGIHQRRRRPEPATGRQGASPRVPAWST